MSVCTATTLPLSLMKDRGGGILDRPGLAEAVTLGTTTQHSSPKSSLEKLRSARRVWAHCSFGCSPNCISSLRLDLLHLHEYVHAVNFQHQVDILHVEASIYKWLHAYTWQVLFRRGMYGGRRKLHGFDTCVANVQRIGGTAIYIFDVVEFVLGCPFPSPQASNLPSIFLSFMLSFQSVGLMGNPQ